MQMNWSKYFSLNSHVNLFGCGVNYLEKMKFFILLISIWTFQVCSLFPLAGDQTPAKEGQYKEHGLVRLGRGEKYPICEGVVMDENYFLTVAGCVHKYVNSLGDLEVVVGTISTETIDSNKNAQKRKISSIEFPPQWADSGKKYGDLALIKVSQPFTFNAVVGAIGSFTYEAAENEAGKIIGYGSDEDLSSFPVKIQSKRQCEEKFGTMSPGTFCVLTKTEEVFYNQDYSGAPCADQKESDRNIYGIYAYEESGVFTSLLFYRDWIERFLGPSKTTKAPSTSSTSGDVTDSPSTGPTPPQNSTTDEPSTAATPAQTSTTTSPPPSSTTTQAATTAMSSTAATPAQTTTAATSSSAAPTQTTVTTAASTTINVYSDESNTDSDEESDEVTTTQPTTTTESEETSESSEEDSDESTTIQPTTTTESEESTDSSDESDETTTTSTTTTESSEESTDESDESSSEETTTPFPTTTNESSEESEESTTTENTKNDNNDFYDDNDKQSMNGQSDDSASNQDSKAQPEVELSQSSVTRNSAQLRHAALPSITNLVSKVGSSFSSIKETISSLIS